MAAWWVSEPWLNLRIEDEPSGYLPARGPYIRFHLSYRQNQSVKEFPTIYGVGSNWSSSFRAYIVVNTNDLTRAYLHKGGAGWVTYLSGAGQIHDGSVLSTVGAAYKIEHRDGSVDTYSTPFTNTYGDLFVFLTTKADPAGNSNAYAYSTNSGIFRLVSVTDPEGKVTQVHYLNGSFPAQITEVVDPYSRTNLLFYDSSGYLTNSVDFAGLISRFSYDSGPNRNSITNLTTPYGSTAFRFGFLVDDFYPFVEVTLPTGGKHLFAYRDYSDFLLSWAPTLPTTTPLTNTFEQSSDMGFRNFPKYNSFHWGPLQYAALSTTDPASLTTADYSKGRMRHWLLAYGDGTLSFERAPSPDQMGAIEGQLTWLDYEGKALDVYPGNSDFPSFVAQVLPDGSTHFSYSLRGTHLNVTNEVSTYSAPNGAVALRTNIFAYAANAIDLLQWTGPRGEQVVSNYFAFGNTIHQPDASYDALNQATTYAHNGYGQITSMVSPGKKTPKRNIPSISVRSAMDNIHD